MVEKTLVSEPIGFQILKGNGIHLMAPFGVGAEVSWPFAKLEMNRKSLIISAGTGYRYILNYSDIKSIENKGAFVKIIHHSKKVPTIVRVNGLLKSDKIFNLIKSANAKYKLKLRCVG